MIEDTFRSLSSNKYNSLNKRSKAMYEGTDLSHTDFLPEYYNRCLHRERSITCLCNTLQKICILVVFFISLFAAFVLLNGDDGIDMLKSLMDWTGFHNPESFKYFTKDEFMNDYKTDLAKTGYTDLQRLNEMMESLPEWKKAIEETINNIQVRTSQTEIDRRIERALEIHEADKIGVLDYASKYIGGSVIGTPETCPFPMNHTVHFLKIIKVTIFSNPEAVIDPHTLPGQCFAFKGRSGRIRIKLGKAIPIKAVTLEHAPLLLLDDKTSAPKDFSVYGLKDSYDEDGVSLGDFTFDVEAKNYQSFNIEPEKVDIFEFVELKINNNYGKPDYTCVYRFRVHSERVTGKFATFNGNEEL